MKLKTEPLIFYVTHQVSSEHLDGAKIPSSTYMRHILASDSSLISELLV
jgi:hypothetical protein